MKKVSDGYQLQLRAAGQKDLVDITITLAVVSVSLYGDIAERTSTLVCATSFV